MIRSENNYQAEGYDDDEQSNMSVFILFCLSKLQSDIVIDLARLTFLFVFVLFLSLSLYLSGLYNIKKRRFFVDFFSIHQKTFIIVQLLFLLVSYPLRLISFLFPTTIFYRLRPVSFFSVCVCAYVCLMINLSFTLKQKEYICIHVSLMHTYIYQLIAFIEKKDTLALLIYKYVKILSIIDGFIYVRIHTRWINN